MTDPVPLAPPPRRVRPIGAVRRHRRRALALCLTLALIVLVALGFALVPRFALLRHAVRVEARVVDHHIVANRTPRYTLFADLPPGFPPRVVAVAVDAATYDRAWDQGRVAFYLDRTNVGNASEDRPSPWTILGFASSCVLLGGSLLVPLLIVAYELTPEQKEERRLLTELPGGVLLITEARPSVTLPSVSVVSGRYVDPVGKRYRVVNLQVPGRVVVGDRVPVLVDLEAKRLRAVAVLTAFEPAPPSSP